MKKAAEYRHEARDIMKRYDSKFIVLTLIVALIFILISACSYGLIGLIATGPLLVGYLGCVVVAVNGTDPTIESVFNGFKKFGRNLGAYLLYTLLVFAWSLLFIIPGIIAMYRYSLVFFLLNEREDLTVSECFKKSHEMMRGHKWKLFCLQLSYLGWNILVSLTAGILGLWILPRESCAFYLFYKDLKAINTINR